MDLDQLRTFLSVLEDGTCSKAAQTLRVGQSTRTSQRMLVGMGPEDHGRI